MSSYSAELNGVRATLKQKSFYYCFGALLMWPSICISTFFVGGDDISNTQAALYFTFLLIIPMIGNAIQGWPILKAVLFGGSVGDALTGPLKADYEVVTVDNSGNVLRTDGGAESMQINFLSRLAVVAVVYMIAGLAIAIQTLYLSIKALRLNAKAKSNFKPSVPSIVLRNVAVTIIPLIILFVIIIVRSIALNMPATSIETELNPSLDGIIIVRHPRSEIVIIPTEIDGLPVIGIKYGAFQSDKTITQITIPEGVTSIGGSAFYRCDNLVSVTLPRSLEEIGGAAFSGCKSLVDVKIPSGIRIDYNNNNYTFSDCPNLSAASQQAIRNSGYTGNF